ncbi:MAG: sensor histidine kinase [Dactylosporangium sp.]|nr:nitrate- and nitrite sensing domain-containing protein [Dactylosporangium sp.]NNJ62866.1 sensor histidine kinase [Dactylosporangium sp.]
MAHDVRRGTIRARLTGILAVPLVGVLVLLGDLAVKEVREYQAANAVTGAAEVGQAAAGLVHELQRERGLSTGVLGGAGADFRTDLDAARTQVDRQRAEFTQLLGDSAEEVASAQTALGQLDDLVAIRAQVDTGRADPAAVFQYFGDRITALNHTDIGLDEPVPDPDPTLRRTLAAFQALSDAKEAMAIERGLLLGAVSGGRFDQDTFSQYVAAHAAKHVAMTDFSRYATASQRAEVESVLKSPEAAEVNRYEQVALVAADGRRLDLSRQMWWSWTSTVIDELRTAQQTIGRSVHHHTDELREEATWDLLGLIPLMILSIIGAGALVFVATRSVARPLAVLAAEADDIAFRRLPAAVAQAQQGAPDGSPSTAARPAAVSIAGRPTREITSVAEAINHVQYTAFTLASEQARLRQNTVDSLANLGRRTQNLLRRQLTFISQLEREEGDPAALANLFELDHLATRLRRNAESLLVLVGETTPRRWSTPLPVADVIRAAISEVEDYRRVSLRRVDDGFIGGGYVTDIAHLLAELIENALTFSPPDLEVEIHGRPLGQDYLIAIVDHGIGMSPENLARANARLRGEERFTVAPTRFLGHYVVGDLSRALSVEVQLVQSPVTGITARVVLPRAVLTTPAAVVEGETAGELPPLAPVEVPMALTDQPERPEPIRTRNGLAKRPPRARSGAPSRPPSTGRPPSVGGPVDHKPAEVRAMLTSLRDGVQRGQSFPTTGTTWYPGGEDHEWRKGDV